MAITKAIGFSVLNTENNSGTSLKPYVVSIRELEEKTGIDFFCNLPDNIERNVESKSHDQMTLIWNINKLIYINDYSVECLSASVILRKSLHKFV